MAKLTVGTENDLPIELHFTDQGSGRPIVLIHGWPLSGRSWEAQVPALIGAGYRVITYDRRGFGQSSQPWLGYDYDTFAADLAALIDHLNLTDVTLIGFSMGGGEVARYLGTYGSGRVRQAVFASAVPPYLYKADDNPDGGLDDATIDGFLAGAGERPDGVPGRVPDRVLQLGQEAEGERAAAAVRPGPGRAGSPKGTLDCITAFSRTDFRADLATITVPTLVIHGDSDGIVPLEVSGARSAESIAGAELVVIKDGPHGVTVSHPEEWNAAVLEFLAGRGVVRPIGSRYAPSGARRGLIQAGGLRDAPSGAKRVHGPARGGQAAALREVRRVHDHQRGDGAGQADVEPAQAGDLVGLAGHDVGRLQQHDVVELQALGQGGRHQVDPGVEGLRVLAEQVVADAARPPGPRRTRSTAASATITPTVPSCGQRGSGRRDQRRLHVGRCGAGRARRGAGVPSAAG